ncbi:MAG: 4-hydroxy-3-methylbut-2-enyl diphosphate reductase [Desulfobulbaceae bacterium]|nr:4-hydroxy-3-methylbut-2-enyl diphosphate reductase [Desulfobulbaceae bacterium]
MKVILAKNAGFCMGVRRAVEATLDLVRKEEQIATFGPLIHNPQVLDLLAERGVEVLKEIPDQRQGTVIIRAHGVPPARKANLAASGAQIYDATCPRVLKVQAIISRHRQEGCATIIIGDRNHAEVEGLLGYAGETGQVVSNEEEAGAVTVAEPYIIVSQTTQDDPSFERLSALILARFPNGQVFNTICDSTHKRQAAVLELCDQVQAMVVVGGKASANTKRLAEIVEKKGKPVFLVESENALDITALARFDCVGVTAGASTPSWMINRVIQALEAIPGPDEGPINPFLHRLLALLMASNLYVALGGGVLASSVALLMGRACAPEHFAMVGCYLFAMHNLNRYSGSGLGRFSDPLRERFWRYFGTPLFVVSWLALGVSLWLAYHYQGYSFPILAVMSLLGVLYSVRFIPRKVAEVIGVKRLKEIPGSKTFFVATAWAFVIIVVPLYGRGFGWDRASLAAFVFVLLLVYIRSALYDVFEVQGDRIVGKETLPVCIGRDKTLKLLYVLMGILALLLVGGPLAGLLPAAWAMLLPAVVYLFAVAWLYDRDRLSYSTRLEFAVDSVFPIIAGLTVLVSLWG